MHIFLPVYFIFIYNTFCLHRSLMKLERLNLQLAAIIIISIIGTYTFSYISFTISQDKLPPSLLSIWQRWDTIYYLDIAQNWYSSSKTTIVFFPAYPILIKLLSFFLINDMLAALVVSNLCYIFACYFLYCLVELDYGKDRAIWAVIYLSIFPTSYFLHAGYTESLFLALTISSFYYARKELWCISSILCMFVTATRVTGILLIPPLILEYLYQKEFDSKNIKKDVLWFAITPLGFFCVPSD